MLKRYLNNYSQEKKMKNKLATILTSAILVLTTNSLPSYALNESSIANAATSETTTNQPTDESRKPVTDRRRAKPRLIENQPVPILPPGRRPPSCRRWVWHQKLRRWVYVQCDKKSPLLEKPSPINSNKN